jgi:hypothetical protein
MHVTKLKPQAEEHLPTGFGEVAIQESVFFYICAKRTAKHNQSLHFCHVAKH